MMFFLSFIVKHSVRSDLGRCCINTFYLSTHNVVVDKVSAHLGSDASI